MKFFSSVAIVFTLIGGAIVTSGEATASGTGCDNRQYSGEAPDPNAISAEITLPYGYLCYLMHNRGKENSEQRAAYTETAGINAPLVEGICNWRIDFVYYDKNGDEYLRDEGETFSSCKGASRELKEVKALPHWGTACAKLFIDGEPRLTQCHVITE